MTNNKVSILESKKIGRLAYVGLDAIALRKHHNGSWFDVVALRKDGETVKLALADGRYPEGTMSDIVAYSWLDELAAALS